MERADNLVACGSRAPAALAVGYAVAVWITRVLNQLPPHRAVCRRLSSRGAPCQVPCRLDHSPIVCMHDRTPENPSRRSRNLALEMFDCSRPHVRVVCTEVVSSTNRCKNHRGPVAFFAPRFTSQHDRVRSAGLPPRAACPLLLGAVPPGQLAALHGRARSPRPPELTSASRRVPAVSRSARTSSGTSMSCIRCVTSNLP